MSQRSFLGRILHSSYWPAILFTDSNSSKTVPKSLLLITWMKILLVLLIGIASIVTPLGLYEAIEARSSPSYEAFHPLVDNSPIGKGTMPRAKVPFTRHCSTALEEVPCPGASSSGDH